MEASRDHEAAVAPKTALTPPTSEDFDKHDGSSSDLSDLEPDAKDKEDMHDEEIEPDHYYDGGRIPVFKPTMDQFRSFKHFISKIDKYGMKSGIVKVIPPQEWRDSLPSLSEAIKTIKVKNPITQEFSGTHGTYTQANIEKQRSYNLPQWKSLCAEDNHQPPAKRGERRRNQDTATKVSRTRAAKPANVAGKKRRPGRPRKNQVQEDNEEEEQKIRDEEGEQIQAPPTPPSSETKQSPPKDSEDRQSPSKSRGGQEKSVASRRKYNRRDAADLVDEAAFEDFDYRLQNLDEYTAERCSELETGYWRSLTFAPPIYGADMPGSLFDESTSSWNVAKLENLLDVLGQKIPGVNTAYLYLGMWKATFAWHLEDVDLYSINYIHFGAPKQWYSISQEDARRFEAAMKTIWPNDAKNCSQFLRHKTYLISPTLLQSQFNIRVNRLVHHEGEFVITFPYGYHSGYNLGYNCAESVNFATDAWLDYGRIAKKCDCEADSVWVNVCDIERKLRGEATPEYYEETDFEDEDDEAASVLGVELPSPPASVLGKPKIPVRKRKRDISDKGTGSKTKLPRLRLRAPAKQPCILCPNDLPCEPLLSTDSGQKAHRVCALYTPETYLAEDNGAEVVCNVANIDKARWELRCTFCQLKRGACFQCSAKKCTKAFHATCAAAAGVRVDFGATPVFGEDGTEYIGDGFDYRCKIHRPKRPKAQEDGAVLEYHPFILDFAKNVKQNDVVQMKYLQGEIFAGVVVENRPGEKMVLVDVLLDGDRIEVEWRWLLPLDPEQSQLPRPSSDAKPLPANMSKAAVKSHHRHEGQPTMNTPFCDPTASHKWAEFESATKVFNPYQAKVDLGKPDQLWFYLGSTSTEAKAQYTGDPANRRHNLKSVFLETVKPAPPPLLAVGQRSYPSPPATSLPSAPSRYGGMAPPGPKQSPLYRSDKPYQYKPRSEMSPAHMGPPITSYRPLSATSSPYASYGPMDNLGHQSYYPNTVANNRTASSPQPSSTWGQSPRPPSGHDRRSPNAQEYAEQSRAPHFERRTSQQPEQWRQSASPHARDQSPLYAQRARSPLSQSHDQSRASYTPFYSSSPYKQNYQQPSSQRTVAPVANMIGGGASTAAPPPQSRPRPQIKAAHQRSYEPDYMTLVQKYPYLRNSYLRRPPKYKSPYAPNGGFTIEYMPVPPPRQTTPLLPRSQQHQQPQPQYQTPQQFMQQVRKEASARLPQEEGKYEKMLSQLGSGSGSASRLTGANNGSKHSKNTHSPFEDQQLYPSLANPSTNGSAAAAAFSQSPYAAPSSAKAYATPPVAVAQPGGEPWRYAN